MQATTGTFDEKVHKNSLAPLQQLSDRTAEQSQVPQSRGVALALVQRFGAWQTHNFPVGPKHERDLRRRVLLKGKGALESNKNVPSAGLNSRGLISLQCNPRVNDPTVTVPLDPTASQTFDNQYYKNLLKGRGVLASDEVLAHDKRTVGLVQRMATVSFRSLLCLLLFFSVISFSPYRAMHGWFWKGIWRSFQGFRDLFTDSEGWGCEYTLDGTGGRFC
jgi:hypothetical protein